MIIRCMHTLILGSQAFTEAHFGQGTGPIVLDDVQCNPAVHRRLLECPSLIGQCQHNCHHFEDAGVACSELKRAVEGNISIAPVGQPSTMYTTEVFLTWEQRGNSLEQNRHSSFRVECTSRLHSATVIVISNQSFTTLIGGLLPSTSYNCCVSAVYENGYTGEGTCVLIETQISTTIYQTSPTIYQTSPTIDQTSTDSMIDQTSTTIDRTSTTIDRTSTTIDRTSTTIVLPSLESATPQVPQGVTTTLFPLTSDKTAAVSNIISTQPQVIGGVLGFIIILLLILLVVMGIALGCVLRTKAKKDMGYNKHV